MSGYEHEGWEFEGPDPEVGIFGDLIVHAACPLLPPDAEAPDNVNGLVTENSTTRTEGQMVRVTTTYTCTVCGSTASSVESWPAHFFEEPRP